MRTLEKLQTENAALRRELRRLCRSLDRCPECRQPLHFVRRHTAGRPEDGNFINDEYWRCTCGYEEIRDRS